MLPPIAYLDFAGRWYGQVGFDLASSGVAPVSDELLGAGVPLDDLGARDRFRQALAARYGVGTNEVVTALGASGALFAAHATLLEPGQRLLVENPSYEPLWCGAQALGVKVDRFERSFDEGYRIEPERVLDACRPETRVVAITNPHNPTGHVASDATLSELASVLAERGVILLIDEAYQELASPRTTARKLSPNIVTCSSATKCWGAGWARAGWLFLPEAHVAAALRVERYVAGLAPPVTWAWGERAVTRADRLLERVRVLQVGKRELVDAFIARHPSLAWVPPPATSVFGWVRDTRGGDLLPLIEQGIREHGVLAAPGTFFGDESAFRLGWTTDKKKLAEGLTRLAKALQLETRA
ncbi:MAG: pyridoxal phosphate-dependent aminotransferase [Myxococcales bacterium]|nr:pyridoxal phosphate-dependent aminotransferase [Myxococcales bacterium]